MAKRSLGDLNTAQRVVLRDWAEHMGVTDAGMMNMLNRMDNLKERSPWQNLDIAAEAIANCDDCETD